MLGNGQFARLIGGGGRSRNCARQSLSKKASHGVWETQRLHARLPVVMQLRDDRDEHRAIHGRDHFDKLRAAWMVAEGAADRMGRSEIDRLDGCPVGDRIEAELVEGAHHAACSGCDVFGGRGPASIGQTSLGQLSENHWSARSYRVTWMSAPFSIAPSFLESPKRRQLNAVVFRPVASR